MIQPIKSCVKQWHQLSITGSADVTLTNCQTAACYITAASLWTTTHISFPAKASSLLLIRLTCSTFSSRCIAGTLATIPLLSIKNRQGHAPPFSSAEQHLWYFPKDLSHLTTKTINKNTLKKKHVDTIFGYKRDDWMQFQLDLNASKKITAVSGYWRSDDV